MKKKLKRNFAAYTDLELFIELARSERDKNYDPEDKKLLISIYDVRMAELEKRTNQRLREKDMMLAENQS